MWPGLVGKGSPGAEPCIDLDTMLDLTAKAEVNGVKFDGVDLFLTTRTSTLISATTASKRIADKIAAKASSSARWCADIGRRRVPGALPCNDYI